MRNVHKPMFGSASVHQTQAPSAWVARFSSLIVPAGRVLDLAAGHGRHARHFAAMGLSVLAVDRDRDALDSMRGLERVETRCLDLETGDWPLAGERFDAICATNYLHRPQFAHLLNALRSDGVLIYETFADGNARFGKPSRPEFLLQPDDLLQVFGGPLRVVAFEQGEISQPVPAVIQRLCAIGRERAWPHRLPHSA